MALASTKGGQPTTPTTSDRTGLLRLGAAGLGAVWAAVIVISLYSPDSVSGIPQEHVPIAAVLTWVWGLMASRSMITTLVAQRDHPERQPEVRLLVGGVAMLWFLATILAVFGPEIVSGTDPTRVPIAAILAPIAAMVLTKMACGFFTSLTRDEDAGRE
jgi:hypothetical protein